MSVLGYCTPSTPITMSTIYVLSSQWNLFGFFANRVVKLCDEEVES